MLTSLAQAREEGFQLRFERFDKNVYPNFRILININQVRYLRGGQFRAMEKKLIYWIGKVVYWVGKCLALPVNLFFTSLQEFLILSSVNSFFASLFVCLFVFFLHQRVSRRRVSYLGVNTRQHKQCI